MDIVHAVCEVRTVNLPSSSLQLLHHIGRNELAVARQGAQLLHVWAARIDDVICKALTAGHGVGVY